MRSEKSSSNSPFVCFSGDIPGTDLSSHLIHFWKARNTAKTVMQGFSSSNRGPRYQPHLKPGTTYILIKIV
ncbi:unnamed protein product, partial [Brassica rapa subsp. narinosa]